MMTRAVILAPLLLCCRMVGFVAGWVRRGQNSRELFIGSRWIHRGVFGRQTTMKRLVAGIAVALSATAMAGIGLQPLSQPALSHFQTSTGTSPANSRPMQVEAASEAIVRATVSGPAFHAPEIFAAIEDYHNPRLKRLRDEYGLEKVVAGEPNEFRRLLKLRHWVHTRWPIDNDQKEGGDAFAILEKAKAGAGFHCSHSLTVQHAVLVSMGYVARDLGVDRNHEDLSRSIHHGVNEVWSNDYAKWVMLDAKYDIHFERNGIPLSALELHEAVRADGGKGVVKMEGVERLQVPMDKPDAPEGTIRSYWWASYYLRPNPFTEPHWSGGSRLLVFDNDAFRNTTWYRATNDGKLVKHWAYAAHAFIPTGSRQQIEWTPGVPDLRARQVARETFEIQLRSATPNFKIYLTRIGGGSWKPLSGDRTRWTLQPGENRFEARTQNLAGVEGPVVSAVVEFKPQSASRK